MSADHNLTVGEWRLRGPAVRYRPGLTRPGPEGPGPTGRGRRAEAEDGRWADGPNAPDHFASAKWSK